MERLTKRTSDGKAIRAKSSTSNYVGTIYEEERVLNQEIIDRLCELEDKIERNELLELPCTIDITSQYEACVYISQDNKVCVSNLVLKSK